jgi:hypothetical protein
MAYLELPNGKYLKVPEGMSPDQAYDAAIAKFPDLLAEAPKAKKGIGAALGRGAESFLGAGQTTLESMFGANDAAKRGLEREAALGQKYEEQIGLDKLKEAYEKKGITGAGGELLRQVPLAIAEQAPNIAATLGSAKIGAMGGSAFGPVGTAVGAGLGALAPSALQLFGSNVQRQASEQQQTGQPVDINVGKALGATAIQAPLDVASTFIPFGGKIAGKVFGKEVEQLLSRGGTEAAEKLAQKSLARTLGEGVAIGAAAEIPTEIGQQMLERYQAGLPLTTKDALQEYGQTAYQAGLLSPLGGVGRLSDRSGARAQVEEKKQEDRRATLEQERIAKEQADMEREAYAKEFYSGAEGKAEIAQRTAEYEQQVSDLRQVLKQKDLSKEDKQTAKQQLEELGKAHNEYLQSTGVTGQVGETTAPLTLEQRLQVLKDQRTQATEEARAGLTLGEAAPQASALPNAPSTLTLRERETTELSQLEAQKDAATDPVQKRELEVAIARLKEQPSEYDAFVRQTGLIEKQVDTVQQQLQEALKTNDFKAAKALSDQLEPLRLSLAEAEKQREALPKEKETSAQELAALDREIKKQQGALQKYSGETFDKAKFDAALDALEKATARREVLQEPPAPMEQQGLAFEPTKEEKAYEKRQAGLEKAFGETDKYLLDKVFDAIGASAEDRGLPETPTEQKLDPRIRIKRALEKQRLAHDNLADAIDDIRANAESPMRFTLVPSAKARYIKSVLAEVDGIREEAKQKPLTNDEKLKLAYDVKDAVDNLVANKNASVLLRNADVAGKLELKGATTGEERAAVSKLTSQFNKEQRAKPLEEQQSQFEKQLGQVKAKYTKGESKYRKPEEFMLRKERDPAQMLRTEEAKAKPNMEVVKALTNEIKARKKEDDRIAAEKAKQEEIDMERYAPSGVNPDQFNLFDEKDLASTATVRATPQNFMRFVGIQSNKLKQSIAAAQRALEAAKPRGTSAQKDRFEAEARQAKTGPLVERLVNRLEDSFSETKNKLRERSAKLREIFGKPLEYQLLFDIAETNRKIAEYTEVANAEKGKFKAGYLKYVNELKDNVAKAEEYVERVQKWDSELFTQEVENNKRSVQMTRKVLKEALAEDKITNDQSNRLTAKVDAAEAKAQADIEKRVVANRKAEQAALELKESLPFIRREVVGSNVKAKGTGEPVSRKKTTAVTFLGSKDKKTGKEITPITYPITPKTAEEKRIESQQRAREGAAERAADKKAIAERLEKGLSGELANAKERLVTLETKLKAVEKDIEASQNKRATPAESERRKKMAALQKQLKDAVTELKEKGVAAERGAETIGAQPGRTERAKPLKTGVKKVDVTKQGMKIVRDLEQEARDVGVSREDYEFVEQGLGFGFKARDEKTQGVGVSQADVKKELGKVKVPKGLDIIVIDKINPQFAELIRARGYNPDTIRGAVMSSGKVMIVAGNHADIKDVKATIAHELIGHVGVEGLLGEAGMKALAKKIQKDENSVFELAKKLNVFDDVLGAYSAARRYMSEEDAVAQAVRELIAHVEETSPNRSFLEKANAFIKAMVGAVRAGLRKMGLDLDISTSDIYKLLRDARANFKDMAPGAHVSKDGNIVFSGKPAVANAGFENALEYTKGIVAEQKRLKDRILGEASGLIVETKYFDSVAPVTKALESIKDSLKATQVMHYIRKHGQRMAITSEVATNGPMDIVAKKRADGQTEYMLESKEGANMVQMAEALREADVGNIEATTRVFTLWMAAQRAKVVGLAKLNFGGKVTQKMLDEVEASVKASPATNDAFKKAASIYAEYNKGLINFAVKTGALSKDLGATLNKDANYVPFYRQSDKGEVLLDIGGAPPIKIGNLADQPYLHELIGGDQPIFDIFTGAMQNTTMLTDMALRNMATKSVANTLGDLGLLKVGEKETGKGIHPGPGPTGVNIIRFKSDGKDYWAEVNSEAAGVPSELLVRGMEGVNTSLPQAVKMMNAPARLLRQMVTRNPAYVLRQLIRDPMMATTTAGLDVGAALGAFKQMGKMTFGVDDGETLLRRRGTLGGQVLTGTAEDKVGILKGILAGKKGWDYRMAQLDQLAIKADASTRVIMYNNFIKQGLSEMEADLATMEAMNFSKRGISPSLFMLSTMVPFMNAQMQGLSVLYKAFTGKMPFNEKLKVKQKLIQRGLMMFGFTMLYASMMQDDEAYQNANDDEKYGNWFVPNPFGEEHIKVPIPFEIGLLFKAIPEAIVNTAFGDEKARDTMSAIGKMAWNSVPISGPQGIKPALEVAINHSFFTGREIESARLQRYEPGERYTERTSEIAKMVGGALNISPTKIEYLIRGYTGSLPLAVASLANPVLRSGETGEQPDTRGILSSETPLIGSFFQAKDASGLVNKAYKDMEEVVQSKETYKKMVEEGRDAEADAYMDANADMIAMGTLAGKFRKQMGDLTKQERAIRADGGLSGAEKREALDEIKQMKIELAKEFSSARE